MANPTKYPALVLDTAQANTLNAIFDTFIACLTRQEEETLQRKIHDKAHIYEVTPQQVSAISAISSSSLGIPNIILEFFANHIAPDKRTDLIRILDLLNSRPGSLLLTGHWTPFASLSRPEREQVLLSWKNARLPSLRNLFRIMSGLCLYNAYSRTHSPLIDSIGHDASHGDVFFETHVEYEPVERERIPMMAAEEATRTQFDVIVVGSGAGGGVAAAELANAGYSVLVIEKGKYFHQSEMIHEEQLSYANMYDAGTSMNSTSGSIQCLSGATFGGGTALNYLVSLKPQHFVREEWAKQGLPYFLSKQFNKDLDRVFERIGASQENILETKTNGIFEKGCHELGYHIEKVHVNTSGKAHHCSRCMMGCKSGIKNSTANTWLLDALHSEKAQFLDQTLVTRVLVHNNRVTGVECQVHGGSQLMTITAHTVIVACGALRTPSLLQFSGLRNPHIGQHLKLQPILFGFGLFDETIRQSDGPLITRVCNTSDDCHGDNYGAKIEEGLLLPGALASKLPWLGAAKHKELMLKHKSIASFVNVVRDKDSIGTVTCNHQDATPVFEYAFSSHDAKSMTVSIERNMKILAAAGARELYTSQPNVEPFVFKEDEQSSTDNPRFLKWLSQVRKAGMSAISTPLVSVHQLGSCRMGIAPKVSAVQPTGETWEVKNLFVADGSIFPTAVGVNPMVTIEALSLHVSRQIISHLKKQSRL